MVPVINDLFKVILLLTFQPKHAEVIDDYQIEPFDFFEELELMPFNAGQFKLIQQSAYSIVLHLVSQSAGTFPQGTCKEGLACSGGAADYDGGSCLEVFSCGNWRFRSKGPQKTDDYFGVKPPKKDFIINKKGRELGSQASNFRSIATQFS